LHGSSIDEVLASERVSYGYASYLADHLGTIEHETDVLNGAVVKDPQYTVFGGIMRRVF